MDKKLFNQNRRLLDIDDIEGENRLKVFDKIGLGAKYTDFAMMLGAKYQRGVKPHTCYQLKNKKNNERSIVVGETIQTTQDKAYLGAPVRLVSMMPLDLDDVIQIDDANVPYVYYGLYPQSIADNYTDLMIKRMNPVTGDTYVVPGIDPEHCSQKQYMEYIDEYEFNNELYTRLCANGYHVFSSGKEVDVINPASIKVEPIKWFLDEETGLLVSEKILSASIPYDYMINHKDDVKRLVKRSKN